MTAFHVAPSLARATILEGGLLVGRPTPRWSKYGICEATAGLRLHVDPCAGFADQGARYVPNPIGTRHLRLEKGCSI